MYELECERDLAVANCRELMRMFWRDPLVRANLRIASLCARTGRDPRIPNPGAPRDIPTSPDSGEQASTAARRIFL
jgi:hypothetical protein